MNLDVSLYYGGLVYILRVFRALDYLLNEFSSSFHGDLNATYPVGKIDKDSERLIRTARECLDAAIAMAKPGV